MTWEILYSDDVLEFVSEEYNRLEQFSGGMGMRFFEEIESVSSRLKNNPNQFPIRNSTFRRAILQISRKLQYSLYFRVSDAQIMIELILPNSVNPDRHP